jgi:iron(III) transport system substrate-binding protein
MQKPPRVATAFSRSRTNSGHSRITPNMNRLTASRRRPRWRRPILTITVAFGLPLNELPLNEFLSFGVSKYGKATHKFSGDWRSLATLVTAVVLMAASGCWSSSNSEVVVYTALDREFSEPILRDFEKETGIKALAKYDVESTKTVGLVNEIIQEQNRPRCDVFWNNEILHTLRLQRLGLLDVYQSPPAAGFPENYRSPNHQWYGFAARARILIVNTNVVPKDQWPRSILELADPKWKDKVGIAKPLFGTTATHAAVLFAHWGAQRAEQFFRDVKQNARVLSGNKQVALAVASGELAFGLTDTDDAIIEKDNGMPIEIVYPDQGDEGMGTLFIPNTLCLIKGSSHSDHARKLIDYLLTAEVESRLAKGLSAQFPVNPAVTATSRAQPTESVKWMAVDFSAAAERWDAAAKFLRDLFTGVD